MPDPRLLPAAAQPALPVEERGYFAFYRAPRFRAWKPVVAIALGAAVWGVALVLFSLVGLLLDGPEQTVTADGSIRVGPWLFLANNASIAVGIPIALGVHWLVFGQRPRWLSSVVGGLRTRWMLRCLAIVGPLWVVLVTIGFVLAPPVDVRWRDHTLLMIVGILLTTPLQAAGEEYLVRGFLGRSVASWFRGPALGFAVSTVVTAVVFMGLHVAADPWLNVFYVTFAVVASWLTWRTGGLEAAIVIHVVNNLLGMIFVPFTDFSDMFDRSVGTGDATVLLNMGFLVAAAVLIDWWARRDGVLRVNAPGRRALEDAWRAATAALVPPPAPPPLPPPGWPQAQPPAPPPSWPTAR